MIFPRSTHTYATLEVSQAMYEEIKGKLLAGGYAHVIHQNCDGEVIDMTAIGLVGDGNEQAADPAVPAAGGVEASG